MERGDNNINLPRNVAHVADRQVRDTYNNGAMKRRWPNGSEDSLFRVAEADMTKVKVSHNRRPKK